MQNILYIEDGTNKRALASNYLSGRGNGNGYGCGYGRGLGDGEYSLNSGMRVRHAVYFIEGTYGTNHQSRWEFLDGVGNGSGSGLGFGLISTRSQSRKIEMTRIAWPWCKEIVPMEFYMEKIHG